MANTRIGFHSKQKEKKISDIRWISPINIIHMFRIIDTWNFFELWTVYRDVYQMLTNSAPIRLPNNELNYAIP